MVNCCSVLGCSNRSNRDGKSYHSIPAIIVNQGERTRELSEQRRSQWIAKLGREKYIPSKYTKICSDHFVSGKPSTLYDISNPDWVPSANMGIGLSLKDAQTLSRYRKAQRAQRKKVLAAAQMLVEMSRRRYSGGKIETKMETVEKELNHCDASVKENNDDSFEIEKL